MNFPIPNLPLGSLCKAVNLECGISANEKEFVFENDSFLSKNLIVGLMLAPGDYGTFYTPNGKLTVAAADLDNMYLTLYSEQEEVIQDLHLKTLIRENNPSGISPVWFPEPLQLDFTRCKVRFASPNNLTQAGRYLPFLFFYRKPSKAC